MNVLEKILEEIGKKKQTYRNELALEVSQMNINEIRNRVSELKDVEEIIRSHMDDVPKCGECIRRKFYMQGYEDGKKNYGWIPVSEKLPEENDGKYYPILNVSTSYGAVKRGFYRVRDKEWYIYSEMHGEFIKAEDKEVIAWQPLPEPYKEV